MCRGHGEMCQSDPDFHFDLAEGSDVSQTEHLMTLCTTKLTKQSMVTVSLSSLLPTEGDPQLLLHVPGDSSIPLPLRPGDYNVDGFPDLLLTIHNATAASSGGIISGSRKAGSQVRVLENVPCGKGTPGCDGRKGGRSFAVGRGPGWEVLDEIWDAVGASWFDIDDDVRFVDCRAAFT